MGFLVQCDFDGTILTDNLGDKLLQAYANAEWQRCSADYKAGLIPLESYNRQAFSCVKESRDKLVQFILENAEMRPHFPELVDYCRGRNLKFVIVSNGLD
ncbi:MAG: haloacid dehalogenase-like hydrolase, partial [Chloroflexota bacterium]